MKFCRYATNDGTRYGVVTSVDGREMITAEISGPQLQVSQAGVPQRVVLPDAESATQLEKPVALDQAKVLIPLPLTSKVMCVGKNYAAHVKEFDGEVPKEPLIFSKPPSSLLAHGGLIVRPGLSQRVDYEGELAVVIGRTCHRLGENENVRDYILGYTCLNDVTARDLQRKDGQWTRAKGFDTFCPLGPVIQTELDPWAGVKVETRVNGEVRQSGTTKDLTFPLEVVIRHIAQFCTLLPGDVIATGTPEGVGPVVHGDMVEVTVEGIGTLRNAVVDEK
ncbi:MAG TPA: fumarylacetoacetate hydrolase family protein [candidate division Zixibacteria bacterium]|nr:fumarylacetoacetate hydrolase family protein [candidate division Zixibacteria bacterium]